MNPNVLMIFPRFNPNSFWSLQPVCDLWGARCPAPPLGLITVAALLPSGWNIRLVDRNASDLSPGDLEWADMVMTGGMLPQRQDTLALIDRCHARGTPVVVGGPDAMSSPEVYERADFLVLGEAEGILSQFVAAWCAGKKSGRFEGTRFQVDVTESPTPRFDLLTPGHYLYIGVQFSRGCPFDCEFCDIIELYGRVPRTKTNEQMLAELDALLTLGIRGHIDFVDDNLIGNKKALKRFLPALADWQERNGHPFRFSTEASMNLADDDELLRMMRDAGFFAVFMGIESPDPETLISAQKRQNTRRDLADSVHKVYASGMFVLAGFIVGFDTEKEGVAGAMIEAIDAMGIPVCMVGLLVALPDTQLARRLQKEGRLRTLDPSKGDQGTMGLNFVTLRPERDVLADYRAILQGIYDPDAYFARVRAVGRAIACARRPGRALTRERLHEALVFVRLAWSMTFRRPELRRRFWGTLIDCARNNLGGVEHALTMMAFYLHLGTFAAFLIEDLDRRIESLDQEAPQIGSSVPRGIMPRAYSRGAMTS
ncbi:MAG TPA: B12-binding domain-containing radical SAM protein [Candidatus Polarisedimenticolia bacterium]|nr:B12-binding domain-containing radical SAM protein [Candidatus Polarisedimenticolia bacterium]